MADCNTCSQYMSTEDILRRSIKCDANGNVALNGGLLNVFRRTISALEQDNSFPLAQYMGANTSADGNTYMYGYAYADTVTVLRKKETVQTYANRGSVATVNANYEIAHIATTNTPDLVFVLVRLSTTGVHHLLKSTDGCATFTKVLTLGEGNGTSGADSSEVRFLSRRNLCQLNNGTLLLGEYNVNTSRVDGSTNDRVRILKSVDNGDTWTKLVEWNTDATNKIGHIHAILQDPYTDYVYICTGDGNSKAAIIRWDGVSAITDNLTPTQINALSGWDAITGSQRHRTVDIIFTENNLFTFSDTQKQNNLEGAESGIWKASKDLSSFVRVNNDGYTYDPQHVGWYGAKINGALVFTTSREGTTEYPFTQLNLRLYTSLDNGETWVGNSVYNCAETGNNTTWASLRELFVLNDKIYLAAVVGAGYRSTDIYTLSGQWTVGDDANVLHPVYYVGNWNINGSDSYSGQNKDAPTATLANILSNSKIPLGARVRLSDTTHTSAGIYPLWTSHVLQGRGSVVIEGFNKDTTIITRASAGAANQYLFYLEVARVVTSATNKLIFKNLTLRTPYDDANVVTNQSAHIKFYNCNLGSITAQDGGRLIALYGGSCEIDRCKLMHPIDILDATAQGIYVQRIADYLLSVKNSIFINEVNHISIFSSGANCSFTAINNTFYNQNTVSVQYAGILPVIFKNNIIFSPRSVNSSLFNSDNANTETEVDYNSYHKALNNVTDGGHSLLLNDPSFKDAANGDFTLLPTSNCRRTGVHIASNTYDYINQVRFNPPCIGAIEKY